MSNEGNPGLVAALTVAATLGGLLFGYDSAVISGVTDAISYNFVLPLHLSPRRCQLPLRVRDLDGSARLRRSAPASPVRSRPGSAARRDC